MVKRPLTSPTYLQNGRAVKVGTERVICDVVYPGVWRREDGWIKANIVVLVRGTGMIVVP